LVASSAVEVPHVWEYNFGVLFFGLFGVWILIYGNVVVIVLNFRFGSIMCANRLSKCRSSLLLLLVSLFCWFYFVWNRLWI